MRILVFVLIVLSIALASWEVIVPTDYIIHSDSESVILKWNRGTMGDSCSSRAILWINDITSDNGNLNDRGNRGYYNFSETLSTMGYSNTQIHFTTVLDSSLLSGYCILVIGHYVRDTFSLSEISAIVNFVDNGGRLLTISNGRCERSHLQILSQFGDAYGSVIYEPGCPSVEEGSHPILERVFSICGEGVAQVYTGYCGLCLIKDTWGRCAFGLQKVGDGLVAVFFDEQFLWNGPTTGIYTDLYEADNLLFAKNLFNYLAKYRSSDHYKEVEFYVNSTDYSSSIHISNDTLVFAPPIGCWLLEENKIYILTSDSFTCEFVDSFDLFFIPLQLSFTEETDCDDRNIVEICYEISGDSVPYDVLLHLSIDSGITWTFPFDSIWNYEGDLGDSVYPGEHCFFWELGHDIPGIEGYYPMRIIASNDEFDCVCSNIYDDTLRYNGTIPKCLILGKIPGELTDIDTNMTYKLGDATAGLSWFSDTTDTNYSSYLRGHIHFTHRYGWSVGHLYIYYNLCSPVMYDTLRMILRKDDDIKLWIDGNIVFEEHNHLSNIDLYYLSDTIIITLDSCKSHTVLMWIYDDRINCSISHWFEDLHGNPATWLRYSLEPDTGGHYVDSVSETTVYVGPLDSKPPRVSLDCPDTSVFVGEEINISWDVEDLFIRNDSGIIIIEYGSETDTYAVADGRFDWTIPTSIDCDTAMIIVELRDSFCNWGYDTCEINILRPGYISILFGDTIGKRCRPVNVPLTIDSADAIISRIMINIEVDTTAAIPVNFTPIYSPTPCSTVLSGSGELWTLEIFWPMRITVTPGILGYMNFMINCSAKAGFFTIIDITSSIADYADVYWRDGSIIVDYRSEPWLTTIYISDNSSPKRNAELTFGANYSASDSYDPLVDLLYLAPPPDGLKVWFDIDDPVFPAVSQLHRDVKDLMTENVWAVIIEDTAGTYVNWSSSTFTEGIYILNNAQDMRVDTWYMAEPFETLIISWDLPRLELDTIAIESGWNMVSLPVFNPISMSNFIFRDILSGPFEYNTATGTFFFPEFVAPGHGYWVYYLSGKDVILVGEKVELVRRNLTRGWDIIGVPGERYSASEIDFDGGTLISVYGYEPSTGMFFVPDSLIPGQSYWLLVDTTGVVEIPR